MGDYGAKISKAGFSAAVAPSESNKKSFIILDSVDSQKLLYAGIVASTSYTHGLGYVPIFYVFTVNNAANPTSFVRKILGVIATTTTISGMTNPSYLLIYHRD